MCAWFSLCRALTLFQMQYNDCFHLIYCHIKYVFAHSLHVCVCVCMLFVAYYAVLALHTDHHCHLLLLRLEPVNVTDIISDCLLVFRLAIAHPKSFLSALAPVFHCLSSTLSFSLVACFARDRPTERAMQLICAFRLRHL